MRKTTLWIVLATLTSTLLGTSTASADVVTDWNTVTLDAIRATRTPPPRATRALAMVHTAIFDAVNGIDRRYEPYHTTAAGPTNASIEAAAASAAHRVLTAVFPTLARSFRTELETQLAAIADGPAKESGIAWGETTAAAILALRTGDGSTSTVNYKAPSGANWWVSTPPAFAPPLLPQWPGVKPWTMSSGSQFRSPGPPIVTDPRYAVAFNEVKDLGRFDSTLRNADQSQIARFWDDGAGTQTPPGHWNEIAQTLAAQQSNTVLENARLFALLNLTVADASIVSWDNKYFYGHWRPYTGIVMAEVDGNPATQRDTGWGSFITTPPFPSYTSGHSTFSGGSGRLLARFFGTDDLAFNAGTDGIPGVVRSFSSLSQAAEEAGQSRIYGGIHWQYENRDGLASGKALADFVFFNFLRPLSVVGPQTCAPTATRLCLNGGRFAAEIDWLTRSQGAEPTVGPGLATPITGDSGGFWFFDEENTEVIVKVLNACTTDDRYWVFAGGATNVEYVLRVTDTQTAQTRVYYNPLDHMAGAVLDSEAFATCP